MFLYINFFTDGTETVLTCDGGARSTDGASSKDDIRSGDDTCYEGILYQG